MHVKLLLLVHCWTSLTFTCGGFSSAYSLIDVEQFYLHLLQLALSTNAIWNNQLWVRMCEPQHMCMCVCANFPFVVWPHIFLLFYLILVSVKGRNPCFPRSLLVIGHWNLFWNSPLGPYFRSICFCIGFFYPPHSRWRRATSPIIIGQLYPSIFTYK